MNYHQAAQASKDTDFAISMLALATKSGYKVKVGMPSMYQIMRGEAPLDMTVGQAEAWRPHAEWEWVPGVGLRERHNEG